MVRLLVRTYGRRLRAIVGALREGVTTRSGLGWLLRAEEERADYSRDRIICTTRSMTLSALL